MASPYASAVTALLLLAFVVAQPVVALEDAVTLLTAGSGTPADPPEEVDLYLSQITNVACSGLGYTSFFIVQRCFWIVGQAGYEALVPYLDNAVSPLSGAPARRVPKAERTAANKRKSVYHSIFTAFSLLFPVPEFVALLDGVLLNASCNPADMSKDFSPVGIGNVAGEIVAEYAIQDGSNQDGTLPDREFPSFAYLDYTGYVPKNTAYKLKYKSKWQPQIAQVNADYAYVQQFVGAQACEIKPLTLKKPTSIKVPKPGKWNKYGTKEYKANTDKILEWSQKLEGNDTAKLLAEFVNAPHPNLVSIWWGTAALKKWTFEEQVIYSFGFYTAAWDATIVTLCYKRKFDTIRPISVIRHTDLYKRVKAYSGPEKGTVSMPARDFKQYTSESGPEPEYPSGSTAVFGAYSQFGRRVTGSEALGINLVWPQGSSDLEPGITPSKDVALEFSTWEDVAQVSVEGRQLGGVHFPQAADEGSKAGKAVGNKAFEWLSALVAGNPPADDGNKYH